MAQQVQIVLIDDIDGGPGDETVSFALDGVTYEIDLSAANAAAFRESLARHVGLARRVGGRSGGQAGASRRRRAAGNRTAKIREWARANGHQVSDRGRISAAVMAAYDRAH